MFGTLQKLYSFIGASSKRYAIFEQMLSFVTGPKTLKSLSDTCWSCCCEALRSLKYNLTSTIDTLAEIAENDAESGSDGAALLNYIQSFNFVFVLILMEDVLTKTNVLSKYLQFPSLNYELVIKMVKETIISFKDLRTEDNFQKLWDRVENISKSNSLSEAKLPRLKSVPLKLGGVTKQSVQNVQDHYKINVYYGFLDSIVICMNNKFKENDLSLLNSMSDVLFNENPLTESIYEVCKTYKLEF